MLDHCESRHFKELLVEFIGPDDAVVVSIYEEAGLMHVFLDEYYASLAQSFPAFAKEIHEVFVSQVTQAPLDPDNIILMLELKALETHLIETIAFLKKNGITFRLKELRRRGLSPCRFALSKVLPSPLWQISAAKHVM